MRDEHPEIERADNSLRREVRRALADVHVVGHVTDQKERRRKNGRDHAGHVAAPMSAPDQIPAARDEDRADEIERRICRRQIGNAHGKRPDLQDEQD